MTNTNGSKSVRVTALKIGGRYIMSAWTKPEKTLTNVVFLGYNSINAPIAEIPQLKSITAESKFFFQNGEELIVADGRNSGAIFIGDGAGCRVTFFEALESLASLENLDTELKAVAAIYKVVDEALLDLNSTVES
jgi:hypothetical protein